jgi:hypothetical protein
MRHAQTSACPGALTLPAPPPSLHPSLPRCPSQLLVDLMSPAALLKACSSEGTAAANAAGKRASSSGGGASGRGRQHQMVTLSADICRAVTAGWRGGDAAAPAGAPPSPRAISPGAAPRRPGGAASEYLGQALLSGLPLAGGGPTAAATAPHGRALLPPELLGGAGALQWSVVDDPAEACSEAEHAAVLLQVGRAPPRRGAVPRRRQRAPSSCRSAQPSAPFDLTHSSAPVQGVPHVTLLLPQDQGLTLGYAPLRLAVPPGGLTAGGLLAALHAHYAQRVALNAETAALLRAAQGGGAAAAGGAAPRSALLGSRLALEGVVRATRDPSGAVYEVLLAQ